MNRVGKKQRERARKQRRAERKVAAARAGQSFAQATVKASSVIAPVCGGTAEQIDATRIWHIARTRPKMGDRTLKALGDIDVAKFVPRLSEVVVRHRRRVVRSTPLLMRTVFIGLRHPADLDAVRAQPGIAEIVSHPESEGGPEGNIVIPVLRPARLDPAELQRLADALAADEVVHPLGLQAFVADAQKLPEAESNGARARAAAQQAALAALDPPKALSDTQTRLAAIQGTAAGLGRVLQDLGMSADEAAAAIRDRTVQAMDALRAGFSADLGAKINEAAGKSYLNDVAALVKERDALMADAQAIGSSTAQVSTYFGLAAQRIVNDSELTGDAFNALVEHFPALRGQVVEFGKAIDTAAAKAAAATRALGYQNRLFAAENDTSTLAGQLAAYDRQAQQEREQEIKEGGQALADLEAAQFAERLKIVRDYQKQAADAERQRMEAATQAFNTFARGIKEYLDGLRAGPTSNLSPADRLAAARSQFDPIGRLRGEWDVRERGNVHGRVGERRARDGDRRQRHPWRRVPPGGESVMSHGICLCGVV